MASIPLASFAVSDPKVEFVQIDSLVSKNFFI